MNSPGPILNVTSGLEAPQYVNVLTSVREVPGSGQLLLQAILETVYLLCYRFYRATRMHSADYAEARCLSVRPSVTRLYSV